MQVAARGPSGGPNTRDDLAHPHLVAGVHTNGFEVVVGGDEPVAVVNLNPVAAAPGVPAGRPHNTGVSGVDGSSAGGCVILAQVEVSRCPADRADPEPERRARVQ